MMTMRVFATIMANEKGFGVGWDGLRSFSYFRANTLLLLVIICQFRVQSCDFISLFSLGTVQFKVR